MPHPPLYPLTFHEIYKDYIWGGMNLVKIGKRIDPGRRIAESWEISDLDGNESVVREGPLAGKTLRELVAVYGEEMCPRTSNRRFPVLIKYLDVQNRASLQLHGDDEFARKNEGPDSCGKHESWYVMNADPQAQAVVGVKPGVTRDAIEEALSDKRIESLLNYMSVSVGDFVDINAGTLHCLLEGVIICEIQQASENLYRLYDWGRLGPGGKSREIHLGKGLAALRLATSGDGEPASSCVTRRADSVINQPFALRRGMEYNVDYLRLDTDFSVSLNECYFHALNILNGAGTLYYHSGEHPFQMGDTILVPRAIETYTVATHGSEILNTFL